MIVIEIVIDGQNLTMSGGGRNTTHIERQIAKEVARSVAGRVSTHDRETITPLTIIEMDQE